MSVPVSVKICVYDAVERVLELHFDAHEAGRAVEVCLGLVEQDGGGDVVELGDGAVEGSVLGQPSAVVALRLLVGYRYGLLVIVGLAVGHTHH